LFAQYASSALNMCVEDEAASLTPDTPPGRLLQGGPGTLGITLAEPLGGGLFTSNVVLGAVVLLSSRSQAVALRPAPFLKDLLFYLAALGAVLMFMRDGKVGAWGGGGATRPP
jgi:hypothetical protein